MKVNVKSPRKTIYLPKELFKCQDGSSSMVMSYSLVWNYDDFEYWAYHLFASWPWIYELSLFYLYVFGIEQCKFTSWHRSKDMRMFLVAIFTFWVFCLVFLRKPHLAMWYMPIWGEDLLRTSESICTWTIIKFIIFMVGI